MATSATTTLLSATLLRPAMATQPRLLHGDRHPLQWATDFYARVALSLMARPRLRPTATVQCRGFSSCAFHPHCPFPQRLRGLENFPTWEARVLNRLRQNSLDRFALGEEACPTALSDTLCSCDVTNHTFYRTIDQATLGYIAGQLTDNILSLSISCSTRSPNCAKVPRLSHAA